MATDFDAAQVTTAKYKRRDNAGPGLELKP
jgi:hypothetical protein